MCVNAEYRSVFAVVSRSSRCCDSFRVGRPGIAPIPLPRSLGERHDCVRSMYLFSMCRWQTSVTTTGKVSGFVFESVVLFRVETRARCSLFYMYLHGNRGLTRPFMPTLGSEHRFSTEKL